MSLKDTLMVDLKTSMREKQTLRKSVITMLRAAIKQIEVDKRIELGDDEVIAIIQKQIKQKRTAIQEFLKGERQDLVKESEDEIEILSIYLPAQLSEDELKAMVIDEIKALHASSMKDMGKVMGVLKSKTAGKADGQTLSRLVKELLT